MPNDHHDQAARNRPPDRRAHDRDRDEKTANPDDPNGALMPARPPDDPDEPIPDTLRMITPEDAARAALEGVVCSLERDELRVLTRIAERAQRRPPSVRRPVPGHRRTRVPRQGGPRGDRGRPRLLACAWLKTETHE